MRRSRGFSMIELLVVIAIILVIAGMAVPYLLRSRMAANEASAVGTVRAINNSESIYTTVYPDLGYTDLPNLGGATPCTPTAANACLLEDIIAKGLAKNGYVFSGAADNSVTPSVAFKVNGNAMAFATTGDRNFYSDQTFVIRYSTTAVPAGPTDPPLQ